jgi:hypothetical protein
MPSPRAVPAGTNTAAVKSASIAMSRRPARIFYPSRSQTTAKDVRGVSAMCDYGRIAKPWLRTAAGSVLAQTPARLDQFHWYF